MTRGLLISFAMGLALVAALLGAGPQQEGAPRAPPGHVATPDAGSPSPRVRFVGDSILGP